MGCFALSYYEQGLPPFAGRSVFLSTAKAPDFRSGQAAQRCPQGNAKSCAGSYKFGFNGQEKVNEIAGIGNHTTALFWEYDTRIARRWNLAPKPISEESPYAVNRDNPIWFNDPNGDYPFIMNPINSSQNMLAFLKGAGKAVIQVAGGFTQVWEHGNGNPNAMSLKDIGNGMVHGVVDPLVNFLDNPNAENLGTLVATGLMFKSAVKESSFSRNVPIRNGMKAELNLTKLNERMAFEEKASIFDKNGNLQSQITLRGSRVPRVNLSKTKNVDLIKHLTRDGSKIGDWDKMAANVEVRGADGKINTNINVHYYQNRNTGKIDYGFDYKSKLGSEYFKKASAKPGEN